MSQKFTQNRQICFFTAALAALFVSCYSYFTIPEFNNYEEVIDIPGMDAATIYRKTDIWLQEEIVNKKRFNVPGESFFGSSTISRSEREIKIGHQLSFSIGNGDVRLGFHHGRISSIEKGKKGNEFYGNNKKEAREYAANLMEWQKKFADDYKAYITKPALSQAEIDALIAKGDAASDSGKFSEAERYYGQALAETASSADIVDIYLAYGMAIQSQIGDPSKTEQFVIDTNLIMRRFNAWVEDLQANPEKSVSFYERPDGDFGESRRLGDIYKKDIAQIDRALDMYNRALSLEPKNETALLCAAYVKERKAYIDNRYSQNNTALNNIKTKLDPEIKRISEQRNAENWERSLNNLTAAIAQLQGNQSGGSAGGSAGVSSGGQSQAGTSSGASSAMRDNYLTMYNRHARQIDSIAKSLLPTRGTDSTKSSYNRMVRTLRAHQRDMRNIRRDAAKDGVTIDKSALEDYEPPR